MSGEPGRSAWIRFEEQFPEALDFLARSMRAGHAFTISLEMIGEEIRDPLGQEFRALFNEQNLGAPLESAMANFTMRVPLLDVRFFTSSVMLQKQTGGNLSEILQRLAYVIRERFKLKGQVKAAAAHGKMTAGILTVLAGGHDARLAFRGARLSARHGGRPRWQEDDRRRDRRADPGKLFHQENHQH